MLRAEVAHDGGGVAVLDEVPGADAEEGQVHRALPDEVVRRLAEEAVAGHVLEVHAERGRAPRGVEEVDEVGQRRSFEVLDGAIGERGPRRAHASGRLVEAHDLGRVARAEGADAQGRLHVLPVARVRGPGRALAARGAVRRERARAVARVHLEVGRVLRVVEGDETVGGEHGDGNGEARGRLAVVREEDVPRGQAAVDGRARRHLPDVGDVHEVVVVGVADDDGVDGRRIAGMEPADPRRVGTDVAERLLGQARVRVQGRGEDRVRAPLHEEARDAEEADLHRRPEARIAGRDGGIALGVDAQGASDRGRAGEGEGGGGGGPHLTSPRGRRARSPGVAAPRTAVPCRRTGAARRA